MHDEGIYSNQPLWAIQVLCNAMGDWEILRISTDQRYEGVQSNVISVTNKRVWVSNVYKKHLHNTWMAPKLHLVVCYW